MAEKIQSLVNSNLAWQAPVVQAAWEAEGRGLPESGNRSQSGLHSQTMLWGWGDDNHSNLKDPSASKLRITV